MKLALILLLAPLLSAQIFYPPGSVRRYAGTPTAGDCTASAIGRRAVDYSAIPSTHYKCSQTSSGVYEWEAEGSGGGGGGDITSVTAGTGLTGGGTSGAVTVSLAADLERTAAGRWKFYDSTGPNTVTIQAGSAQSSANLQEWQNSGGTALVRIDSSGNIVGGSNVNAGSAGFIYWASRTFLSSPSNGNLLLQNSSGTAFSLLQFGGTSNSFNAIGRDAVNGFTIQSAAGTATYNDASTSSSGTVTSRYLFGIAAPTLTATNASVTYTTASTLRIGGAPTASTNVTIGTPYALEVAAGNVIFNGGSGAVTHTIQAGSGQSTTNALQFTTSAGAVRGYIYSPDGATYNAHFYDFVTINQGAAVIDASGSGVFALGNAGTLKWSSTSVQSGSKDLGLARFAAGILKTTNGSSTDYFFFDGPNLRFSAGGTSSSFPMLARSSATWEAKLADNSAYTSMTMSEVYLGGAAGTDGTWKLTVSGGSLLIQKRESGSWVSKQIIAP